MSHIYQIKQNCEEITVIIIMDSDNNNDDNNNNTLRVLDNLHVRNYIIKSVCTYIYIIYIYYIHDRQLLCTPQN